ncbi:hypothetical protein F5Y05DRAFT_415916 [Hypoxylon sp. FL0543]|nr:hypothetical protein F5Y05DRAFT_415916 [Hypoxylon sp. FL0543]
MERSFAGNSEERPAEMARFSDPDATPLVDRLLNQLRQHNQELERQNAKLRQRNQELEKQNAELIAASSAFRKEIKEIRDDLEAVKEELSSAKKHEAQLRGEINILRQPTRRSARKKQQNEAETRASELEKELKKIKLENSQLRENSQSLPSVAQNMVQAPDAQYTFPGTYVGPVQPVAAPQTQGPEQLTLSQRTQLANDEFGVAPPTQTGQFNASKGYMSADQLERSRQLFGPNAVWRSTYDQQPPAEPQNGYGTGGLQ